MIRLIAALDQNRGIGKHGGQPWKLPTDEAYFARMTKGYGGVILVGSTTYQTFKGPLPERRNFVLTSRDEPLEGVELVHNLKAFLEEYKTQDLWVIGGAQIYKEVIDMGRADELYLTHIESTFACDRFFPEYLPRFQCVEQGDMQHENGLDFYFARYTPADYLPSS